MGLELSQVAEQFQINYYRGQRWQIRITIELTEIIGGASWEVHSKLSGH
jgi:hypothetical protein